MITMNIKRCTGCGTCVRECVDDCIRIDNGTAVVKKQCIQCGHCIAVCPADAVKISDSEYDANDIEKCDYSSTLDSGSLLRTIKQRRSIRQYKKQLIEKEKLDLIIQAGRYTATGANCQKFHFAVVQQHMDTFKEMAWQHFEEAINALPADSPSHNSGIIRRAKMYRTDPVYDTLFWGAPCLIVVASESEGGLWDAGMSSQAMELMACSQELGMLFSGYLVGIISKNEDLKEWLGISGLSVKTCLLLGYPDVKYLRTAPRKFARVNWR